MDQQIAFFLPTSQCSAKPAERLIPWTGPGRLDESFPGPPLYFNFLYICSFRISPGKYGHFSTWDHFQSIVLHFFIAPMLKKINAGIEADRLRPGDSIFDNTVEELAREFKIKWIILNCLIAVHNGDFPSVKIIRRSRLISGQWSIMTPGGQ
jgi:hypothetical protein